MVASRDPENDKPGPDDLYDVGVAGTVARMMKVPDGTLRILVQGAERMRITDYVSEQPYLVARIEAMPDVIEPSTELEALTRNVQSTFTQIIEAIPYLPEELQLAVANMDEPSALCHLIAGALRISTEEKQELLERSTSSKRLRRLSEILTRELEVVQLGAKIQSAGRVRDRQGPARVLPARAAEGDPAGARRGGRAQAEIDDLRQRIEEAESARGCAEGCRARARAAREAAPGRRRDGVIRTYLEWLVELPWTRRPRTTSTSSMRAGPRRGPLRPRKVKERILEYLAVRKLNPDSPGPILCFVGPPGVGKTSLGRSIAKALGPQVRAHRGRRRPRRGRDPRPPPDLHRRPAGHDHPRAARRRHPQPGLHARRDRQDGRRLPRRPRLRDARGARPGAELDLQRPLPRRAVRPLRGPLHRHGEHPRPGPGAAPGPDGGDRDPRLHGRGEAPHRQAATSCRASSRRTA